MRSRHGAGNFNGTVNSSPGPKTVGAAAISACTVTKSGRTMTMGSRGSVRKIALITTARDKNRPTVTPTCVSRRIERELDASNPLYEAQMCEADMTDFRDEPTRMVNDPNVSPELRRALSAAADWPSSYDIESGLRRLLAACWQSRREDPPPAC